MNPYKIEPPFVVSFSGGRTSGYMLKQILDAYDGKLPVGGIVCFANTGKEHEATLKFVHDIEQRWCPIAWIEYRPDGKKFEVVTFETANRDGFYFAEMIRKRKYLPNPIARFCTSDLKVIPMKLYMESLGFEDYVTALGLRSDEPRRVAKILGDTTRNMAAPLHFAGATEETVLAYWKQSEFDLMLPNNDKAFGNCDLCFLKSQSRTERVIEHEPVRANWWADMEALVGAKFRKDRAMYKDLLVQVTTQGKLFQDQVDDSRPCDCTE